MKAQRRHELQENELAKVIKNAPTFWQESGGKFLAGAIVVLIIVILIQYRVSSRRTSQAQALQEISTARRVTEELANVVFGDPNDQATRRRLFFNDANDALARAMQASDDPKLQAEALVAKGDLNWQLAALPPVPGATTQQALQVRDPKDLLANSAEAYQAVLSNFSDQKYAAIAARFGLAAIAENRKDWDTAKSHYEKAAVETKGMPAYQSMASVRLGLLDQLKTPVIIGKPATQPELGAPPATTQISPLVAAPAGPPSPATTQATAAPPAATTTAPATRP
jgi:hypothetical protein